MFKILIAVDGSEHANRAIEAVATMSKSSVDVQATLLCVSPPMMAYDGYTANTMEQIETQQKKQQDDTLREAEAHAKAHGLKVGESLRAKGLEVDEIIRAATELAVDQIAIGTRGMSSLGSLILGSVAQRVVHLLPVPVLLVK
jgi:nucleotide-binding universal stress UspA family protein